MLVVPSRCHRPRLMPLRSSGLTTTIRANPHNFSRQLGVISRMMSASRYIEVLVCLYLSLEGHARCALYLWLSGHEQAR
jgi:hypothetical protein